MTRDGNFIYYQLANEKVFYAWRALRERDLMQNAEAVKLIKDFYNSRHQVEPVSMSLFVLNGGYKNSKPYF